MSNNNIVDSSTNSHSVTVSGDVQQGTFSPYAAGGYSTSFSGGSIGTPVNQLDFSGDFTIEGWFNKSANGSGGYDGFFSVGTAGSPPMMMEISSTRGIFFWVGGEIMRYNPGSGYNPNTSQWTHIALVRASGTTKIYLDGVEVASSTTSYTLDFSSSSDDFYIGSYGGTAYSFNGLISDFRMSSSAVYTSDFTPPTERLTTTSDTALLACHLPYVGAVNNSGSVAITQSGSVSTDRDAPYDFLDYDAATHGGSVVFDGTGDIITVPSSTDFDFGTDDFTIEFWMNLENAATGTWQAIMSRGYRKTGGFRLYKTSGVDELSFYYGTSYFSTTDAGLLDNVWHHIVVARTSGTVKIFVDGSEKASQAISYDFTNTYDLEIGKGIVTSEYPITGHMSDVRIVKGTAVYTADFTPPTAPLTAVTNTSLLLPFDDATIVDRTGSSVLSVVGDTAVATATPPYAGSSYFTFDGTEDRVIAEGADISLAGDFTIEAWIYPEAAGRIIAFPGASANAGLEISGTSLVFNDGTTDLITGGTISTSGQWQHVAVSKSSGTTKMFVDGTEVGSSTTDNAPIGTSGDLYVGSDTSGNGDFAGSITDVRITTSAEYTSDFTPPNGVWS